MTLAGLPASKYYRDARLFVETYEAVADYYNTDIITPIADVYNFEIEAMGARMVYSENAMPTIDFREPLIKQPEDLQKLKTPDFYHDGRLPFALDCYKLSRSKQGNFCGIFSMAVGLRSYPVLIKDMRRRPEFVRELFTFIIDRVLIPYLKVQKAYCGISTAVGADAWVNVPSLSVREMKEWILPYYTQLMDKGKELGIKVIAGGADYCEEDPSKFDAEVAHGAFDVQMVTRGGNLLTLGMGNWHKYPLEAVLEYTAPYRAKGITITINAGVNARLLRDGPVDAIVGAVKRYVNAFARDHNLVIWLANVPADTSPGHIHAAVTAAHTYGRFPIADNLDKIKFELPKRETFQEWQRQRTA